MKGFTNKSRTMPTREFPVPMQKSHEESAIVNADLMPEMMQARAIKDGKMGPVEEFSPGEWDSKFNSYRKYRKGKS